MSQPSEELAHRLAGSLRPVRRLARPGWRAAWWLALLAAAAAALAARADLAAVAARLAAAPDMWLSVIGSIATAIGAAVAATMLALPDRDPRWAWLPFPGLLLWLAASGAGCLRGDVLASLHPASFAQSAENCLPFILKGSVALGLPLAWLVWRARPLRPGAVAAMAALACAAGSASLLWLFHPFDASLADLVVHAAAVGFIVLAGRAVAWAVGAA